MTTATLPLSDLSRMMRDAVKSKAYQGSALGQDVAAYLRARKKELAKNSLDAYESTLHKFVVWHGDLTLSDFEPPIGTTRVEEWLEHFWGEGAPSSYNRHLAVVRDFFKWQAMREQFEAEPRLHGDPTLVIRPAKKREVYRTTFGTDQTATILAANDLLRDRIALRLLLHYGLRRGGLQAIQFKHFDHSRKRLTVFLKGGKVRAVPIPEDAFWNDLDLHKLDSQAQPNHYLMTARWRNRYGYRDKPEQPMSAHALHKWWYRCLANAGVVPEGTTAGERMHKARHTAGQAVLDATQGNLKAVQKMLGHASIKTTADVYVDYDVDALADILAQVHRED